MDANLQRIEPVDDDDEVGEKDDDDYDDDAAAATAAAADDDDDADLNDWEPAVQIREIPYSERVRNSGGKAP